MKLSVLASPWVNRSLVEMLVGLGPQKTQIRFMQPFLNLASAK
jgi:hypothetical protein